MNKITIELDTILDKGLLEYLKTIDGIENCDINEGKISIVYKDNISLVLILVSILLLIVSNISYRVFKSRTLFNLFNKALTTVC